MLQRNLEGHGIFDNGSFALHFGDIPAEQRQQIFHLLIGGSSTAATNPIFCQAGCTAFFFVAICAAKLRGKRDARIVDFFVIDIVVFEEFLQMVFHLDCEVILYVVGAPPAEQILSYGVVLFLDCLLDALEIFFLMGRFVASFF